MQKLKFLQEHGKKYIFFNFYFFKGIKSNVPENEFDFTFLTPEHSKKEIESEVEAVEAIEEDLEKGKNIKFINNLNCINSCSYC